MLDCSNQIRGYVEGQELERAISLDVESIVDAAMAEAPRSVEEALLIADEMIDEACINGRAQYQSALAEDSYFPDEEEFYD